MTFKDSSGYWERRYQRGGNSGAGSYGRLAAFKAELLNSFMHQESIQTVIEFGCGDGNQLTLADYPSYVGFDVSYKSLDLCRDLFDQDESKSFFHVSEFGPQRADLALSLDVIFHLVEDDVFEKYMNDLFSAALKFVIVYSSNYDDEYVKAAHVRHRCFADWIKENASQFELISKTPNMYPYDASNPKDTTFADFYIYKKKS